MSIEKTVDSIETTQQEILNNISMLEEAAEKGQNSSNQAKNIISEMTALNQLIDSQYTATNNISSSVAKLLAITGDTNQQSSSLDERSQTLSETSQYLRSVIDEFKFRNEPTTH